MKKFRFDSLEKVYRHVRAKLLGQHEQSIIMNSKTNTPVCVYRGKDGRRCAVGWLIVNRAYRKALESRQAQDREVRKALRLSGVDLRVDGMLTLLKHLQWIHDNYGPDDWRAQLDRLALQHKWSV